jgi:uncharacterized membrane protein YhaH (DUF805 family)
LREPNRVSRNQYQSENFMTDVSSFRGRISRARYWGLTGFCVLAIIAGLVAVVGTVNQTSQEPVNVPATIVAIAGIFIFVAACVALFVVGVWRLHDRGKSGFWIILYYVVPSAMAFLAIDPDGPRTMLRCVALAILVWAAVDLGILKDKPA